jgi:hypothetical protein
MIGLALLLFTHTFDVQKATSEIVADVEMSAPQMVHARVTVDGSSNHHITAFAAPARHVYPVFLGRFAAGRHELRIDGAQVHGIKLREILETDPEYQVVAYSPVLFARRNTIGKFTDLPLIAYCERLPGNVLQYTVVFSNEDGGTSTRALMARWGRTTDIEYIYRRFLDTGKAIIQGRNHQDMEYQGPTFASHPMLLPVTDNNMVASEGESEIRYHVRPKLVDLSSHSREQVMDEEPVTYEVAVKELVREAKLREYGKVDGEKISDPRNYLTIEYKAAHQDSALDVRVRLKGQDWWQSSSLGRLDYAISRDGWVRTTVELPPGTRADQIGEVEFQCVVVPPPRDKPIARAGVCKLESVSKMFLLEGDGRPGPNFWKGTIAGEIPTGRSLVRRFQ